MSSQGVFTFLLLSPIESSGRFYFPIASFYFIFLQNITSKPLKPLPLHLLQNIINFLSWIGLLDTQCLPGYYSIYDMHTDELNPEEKCVETGFY